MFELHFRNIYERVTCLNLNRKTHEKSLFQSSTIFQMYKHLSIILTVYAHEKSPSIENAWVKAPSLDFTPWRFRRDILFLDYSSSIGQSTR